MIDLVQAGGEHLVLSDPPRRIVSLVPSITENLLLFGIQPVGRTSFCIEPRDRVAGIPSVGGTKTPSLRRIQELAPDLIIANQEENRKQDVEDLESRGFRVWVTYPRLAADVVPLMRAILELGGDPILASPWMAAAEDVLSRGRVTTERRPRVLVLIWKSPWMVVGRDTYTADLVRVAGGELVVPTKEGRYPEITEDEMIELAPDIILLPSEPYSFSNDDRTHLEREISWKRGTPQIRPFSGEDLTWSGPRLVNGLEKLRSTFAQT